MCYRFRSSLLSAIPVIYVGRSTPSMASCSQKDILTFLRGESSCQYGNTEKSLWRVWKNTKLLFLLEKQGLGRQHRYIIYNVPLLRRKRKHVCVSHVEVSCVNGFVWRIPTCTLDTTRHHFGTLQLSQCLSPFRSLNEHLQIVKATWHNLQKIARLSPCKILEIQRVTGFYCGAKCFELNFLIRETFALDGQISLTKSSSRPVNLLGAWEIRK